MASFDAATAPSASGASATALAIITDPGEDLDDEMGGAEPDWDQDALKAFMKK